MIKNSLKSHFLHLHGNMYSSCKPGKKMVCKTTSFYRLKSIEDYSKEQETQQKELQEELETSKAQLVQLFQVCVD